MRGPKRERERGFALLIVLWSMALLGLLGTRIAASGRTDAREAGVIAERATMESQADGAVADALFEVATGAWPADGRLRPGPVAVRIENEAGLINVNLAPAGLIAALLSTLGLPADKAQSLGAAISDWRTPTTLAQPSGAKLPAYRAAGLAYGPRDAPFRDTAELGLVLGMTPSILALLEPHVTVSTEGDVDPALADPAVREALIRYGGNVFPALLPIPQTATVLRVTATVSGPNGARFGRVAVVRLRRLAHRDDPVRRAREWR